MKHDDGCSAIPKQYVRALVLRSMQRGQRQANEKAGIE
jgi:hypothetical protein